MIKLARIKNINDAQVELDLQTQEPCTNCQSRCHSGFLDFIFHKSKSNSISVARNKSTQSTSHLVDTTGFFKKGYKVNEIIGLDFKQTQLLKLSFLLYGLPIVLALICLMIGYSSFSYYQLSADAGGSIGLLLGLFLAKQLIRYQHKKFKPQVKFFK